MKLILCVAVLFLCQTLALPHHQQGKGRIIGGSTARVEQFPYAAAIYTTMANGRYFYGGTVISNQWILTSGQAVNGAVVFEVHVGSISLNNTYRVYATSEYTLHPDFNPDTLENDIGLIKLRLPIEFDDRIQVSYLPSVEVPITSIVTAIGWGQISDETEAPVDVLEYVQVTTVLNDDCEVTYGSQIKPSMLCVTGNYNQGACFGDMGSPLVQYLSPRYTIVVAVASFVSGNGCESTDPSGYTRVYPFVNWIRDVSGVL